MKITELRAAVFQITEVETTQKLKRQYSEIKSLDMRYKVSWEKALELVKNLSSKPIRQSNTSAQQVEKDAEGEKRKANKKSVETTSDQTKGNDRPKEKSSIQKSPSTKQGFDEWLANPPDEYKTLFSEINTTVNSFNDKLGRAKQLVESFQTETESLHEFANASEAEAQLIKEAARRADEIAQKANLN